MMRVLHRFFLWLMLKKEQCRGMPWKTLLLGYIKPTSDSNSHLEIRDVILDGID